MCKGLFYGGAHCETSATLLLSFMAENFGSVEHYVHVDVHTGLGSRAHDMLIVEDAKRMEDEFGKLLGTWEILALLYSPYYSR